MNSLYSAYRRLLENWIPAAMENVFTPSDRPDLSYYGTGTNVWGIQTHQKAFAAFAVLAADPDTRIKSGPSREELLDISLAMLRFTIQSHHTGNYHCMDSETEKWGHHWLSTLAVERMMHGVEAIWAHIPETDRDALKTMLVSECDWTLENREVQADLFQPNVPESNLWNGAILHRAAMLYPDLPRAADYRRHGTHLLLNSISVAADAGSDRLYDGRPLSEWHVGANFHDSFSLCHHGYLNVGYMVICLSNIAMLHFSYRARGLDAPPALYHHCEQLWQLVRSMVFADGRLLRIGGDTRVRYCYCQDYLIPVLLFAADCLGDRLDDMERGWLAQVEKEMTHNGDGTFLSERCELFVERSPLYFTRLESDRACTLSMGAYWRRLHCDFDKPAGTGGYDLEQAAHAPLTAWQEHAHGASYVRGADRMASFVWQASAPPTGLCVSPHDSSMAEWKNNLTGFIEGNGLTNFNKVLGYGQAAFEGGFITAGCYEAVTTGLLEENDSKNINVKNTLVFAALPDGRTVITMQTAKALRRCHLLRVHPLNLQIPNDIFNDFTRDYTQEDAWVNISGRMSVIALYGGKPVLQKPAGRQIGINSIRFPSFHLKDSQAYAGRGMLHCDELHIAPVDVPTWYDKDAVVFDIGAVLVTEIDAAATKQAASRICIEDTGNADLRAVTVMGQDGFTYRLELDISRCRARLSHEEQEIASTEMKEG